MEAIMTALQNALDEVKRKNGALNNREIALNNLSASLDEKTKSINNRIEWIHAKESLITDIDDITKEKKVLAETRARLNEEGVKLSQGLESLRIKQEQLKQDAENNAENLRKAWKELNDSKASIEKEIHAKVNEMLAKFKK